MFRYAALAQSNSSEKNTHPYCFDCYNYWQINWYNISSNENPSCNLQRKISFLLLLRVLEFFYAMTIIHPKFPLKYITADEKSIITFLSVVSLLLACCLLSFCHSRDSVKWSHTPEAQRIMTRQLWRFHFQQSLNNLITAVERYRMELTVFSLHH